MRGRRNFILFTILAFLVVFVTGCSSTPEAEPGVEPGSVAPVTEPTTEAVVETPVEPAVDTEALARAAELAADSARLMAELAAAQELAVAAGSESLFPDQFAGTSAEYDALVKAWQENPDKDYRNQMENLRDTYLAMTKLAQALQVRERLVTAGLEDADPENFQKGEDAVAQVETLYNEGAPGFQLIQQATIAYDSYFTILAANLTTMCEAQRERALAAKEKADSIKSAMAAKEEYAAAELTLTNADAAYAVQSYEKAYDGYVAATNDFTAIYDDVFVRRAIAEEAIRRAKQKVDTSAAIAAEADEIAPLQDEEETAESNEEVDGTEAIQEEVK